MKISVQNILYLQNKGELKKLATFIFLKRKYVNSCVFDYNIKSLSKKTSISRHHIRQNIKFFMAEGWCRMHCGNLVFNKYASKGVKGHKEFIIRNRSIFKDKSIKEIETILLSLVLKNKQAQHNYIQEVKSDLTKSATNEFLDLKAYKKAIKAKKKYGVIEGEEFNFKLSVNTIGKLFGVSRSSASSLLKRMQRMALVRITGFYPEYIGHCTKAMWKAVGDTPGLIWLSGKNMVFIKRCNEYCFL